MRKRNRLGDCVLLSADRASDHPRHVVKDPSTQGLNDDVMDLVLPDLLGRGIHFGTSTSALHEHELTAVAQQGRGQRQQLAERADRTSSHLIQRIGKPDVLATGSNDAHIHQAQLVDLLRKPGDPPLHRLDENEIDIRASDRQHETRKTCPATDVTDQARPEERGDDRAVQDMAGPEAGELKWPDEPAFLALRRKVLRERASNIQLLSEENRSSRGLGLEGIGHDVRNDYAAVMTV
jgi:hypothetical protein